VNPGGVVRSFGGDRNRNAISVTSKGWIEGFGKKEVLELFGSLREIVEYSPLAYDFD
jgi:hypothetical protein